MGRTQAGKSKSVQIDSTKTDYWEVTSSSPEVISYLQSIGAAFAGSNGKQFRFLVNPKKMLVKPKGE